MSFHEFSLESKKSPTFNLDDIIRRQSEIVKRTSPQFNLKRRILLQKIRVRLASQKNCCQGSCHPIASRFGSDSPVTFDAMAGSSHNMPK